MQTDWPTEGTEMDSGGPLSTRSQSRELEVGGGCSNYAVIAQ